MNKSNIKIVKTKKCTSTNCEQNIDLNEKVNCKKHSKNGLINGFVNNVQDSSKVKELMVPNKHENVYKTSEPQEENSAGNSDSKGKLTKLDSNENISESGKMHEASREESDVSFNLSNNSTMEKSADTRLVDESIENLVEDFQKVEIQSVGANSIEYVQYESELQMPMIMKIIQKDLSEPYSIYTYRYFIHNWPKLCFLAMYKDQCVGAIVCKLDIHRKVIKRGYIAMLAVDQNYRKLGIGSTLVRRAIQEMITGDADEVVLETEVTNKPALQLYEALGFVRDKRLFRYYLNGVDALRLKLWLR